MSYKVGEVLFSEKQIAARVEAIAKQIKHDYASRNGKHEIIMLGILKGCAIFMADLVRAIGDSLDVRMDFMVLSSYGADSKSSGVVRILKDLDSAIEGKDVIIVEDIIDTGLTMSYLLNILEQRKPASLKVCSLLNKQERRKVPVALDYCGFEIPDAFVVGYGLDYAGKWRQLRDIRTAVPV